MNCSTDDGEPRPHYANLFQRTGAIGPAELKRRAETCRRLVHEQGITYNVYGDPRGMERPWQLDPVPFVIAPDEWRTLEAGLIQRATLLNKILADCYGAQELIRSRWLSPALVFAQPDFLRPCHGIRVPEDLFLHFYAADLARSPDGRWWVISDRTQIPTGAGYALANRLVTSRILPESFRDNHVHRLAGFFPRRAGNTLARLAPRAGDRRARRHAHAGPAQRNLFRAGVSRALPRLHARRGPGPDRARQLRLSENLSGLERVDVILRRVDDDFCDPLELRNDSMLGVPGLVEALRAGNVTVANALGSGLLQSPAFMSFLPGLCRHILGEELKLPSVATWWCGQKSARGMSWKISIQACVKPAFRTPHPDSESHQPPSKAELDQLRRRIEFDPDCLSRRSAWNFPPRRRGMPDG
jgi:uncharacterized circularly permuted ATP-grasp superfamily protein